MGKAGDLFHGFPKSVDGFVAVNLVNGQRRLERMEKFING